MTKAATKDTATPRPRRVRTVTAREGKLAGQVYEKILDDIIHLRRLPGEMLNKEQLRAELGTSAQPVTDALRKLAGIGLAEVVPQVGSFVSRISARSVIDSVFLRSAVESQVVAQLAETRDEAAIKALRGNLAAQEKAVRAVDIDQFHRLDDAFHLKLYQLLGYPGVWDQTASARLHLDRLRRLALPREGRLTVSLDEHTRVVDEIAAGHPQEAARAIEAHIRFNTEDLRRHMRDRQDFFEPDEDT